MSPRALTFALGAAIIVVANGFALGGVAWNRSGEAGSRLALSQRERTRPAEWGASREDSSLALSLQWRLPHPGVEPYKGAFWSFGGSPAWLDEQRMAELGFDVEGAKAEDVRGQKSLRRSAREVRVGCSNWRALPGSRRLSRLAAISPPVCRWIAPWPGAHR